MGRLPKGWKKILEKPNVIVYSKGNYLIYIWKRKKFCSVEPFRKLTNYKRRLFAKEFKKLSSAKKFAWQLMKQKEIRGYYLKSD